MSAKPPIPEDEARRLEVLRAYEILDTAPEQAFDRLTSLAAQICEAPIALVSLVDRDRQWFKSRFGLDASETPRDLAFCAHAILGKDVLIVPDATRDARFKDNPLVTGPPHIRSYAGAPLIARDGVKLGTLCVIHDEVVKLNGRQIEQLEELAAIAVDEMELRLALREIATARAELIAMAEERERLYQENERDRRFIETLIDTVPIPIFSRDDQQRVTLANPAYAAFLGLPPEGILGRHLGELYDQEAVLEILEEDQHLQTNPQGHKTFERQFPCRSTNKCRETVVHKALIRANDGSFQGIVGAIVDMTDQKALQAELQNLATTDPLTGAANRHAFMERAERECQRSRRYGHPLSLIMIDIDNFKMINDTYGHSAGDRILQIMCDVCRGTIRESIDHLSRWGGEEFLVLAPETDGAGAAALAERLRQRIADEEIVIDGRPLSFTASFGVATADRGCDNSAMKDLLEQADKCLYRSKSQGRNRVTAAACAEAGDWSLSPDAPPRRAKLA